MISGSVSPKSIGLMDREHINKLLKKFKLLFEVMKISIIGTYLIDFCLSGIPLFINSSIQLILIEIFWSLLFTAFVYFSVSIELSQMTYFNIICLYLKLKLRNANNSIRKISDKKHKMTNQRIKNILISMDSIISEINTYNNDFWSKYLMIVLMLIIIALDLVLFLSIFGKFSFFFKLLLFYGSNVLFLLIMILINNEEHRLENLEPEPEPGEPRLELLGA